MSKAFTSADTEAPPVHLPLPVGRRAITTPGMQELRRQHTELLAQLVAQGSAQSAPTVVDAQQVRVAALQRRLRHLGRLIELSDVAPAPGPCPAFVTLGTRVRVGDEDGAEWTYVMVGPDEVDVAARKVSHASPVGQALMGRKVAARAFIKRPAGVLEVTILAIEPA